MAHLTKTIPLGGGLDLVHAAQSKRPGSLLSGVNYEPSIEGGYARIQGYEIFDGQPSPSDATYYILDFDAGTNEPSVGGDILGGTSAATAEILAVVVESGSWAGNDAAGYLAITKVSGTWQNNENIRDSGDTLTHAVEDSTPQEAQADTDALHATYKAAAIASYRTDIAAVPGSGVIRGIHIFNDEIYAFRDNAGGTAVAMYKATTAGWALQDLGTQVTFDTGSTAEPAAGATVTGGTSASTGVVINTVVTSGTFAGNNAVGYLYLHTASGAFTGGETITYSGGSVVETANAVNTLPAAGNYEFVNYNFYGQADSIKMYGCNGVGPAFQWDDNGLALIHTGAATDTPSHITAHKNHLFVAVDSSVLHSSIGEPLDWLAATGAAEIATGDEVLAFVKPQGEAMTFICRNITYMLYGTNDDDWELRTFAQSSGCIEWTAQNMGTDPIYLDDRGLTSLSAVGNYGDFKANEMSKMVRPYVKSKKNLSISSIQVREKNQYRLFFSDNIGLIMANTESGREFTTLEYDHPVRCTTSEEISGTERMFFGSDAGEVFEMDKGESFDGDDISYSLRLVFDHMGHPRRKKRYFKVILDVDSLEIPDLNFYPDFSFADRDIPSAEAVDDTTLTTGGGQFDGSDEWNSFSWDGQLTGQAEAYLDGSGINMSLLVIGESDYEKVHRLHGISIHYGIRGVKI